MPQISIILNILNMNINYSIVFYHFHMIKNEIIDIKIDYMALILLLNLIASITYCIPSLFNILYNT